MIPRALSTAATDPELQPRDLAVYVCLHEHLDYLTYRPLKQTWLVRRLRMARTNLAHTLGRLVQAGYLDRRGGHRGVTAHYRLPFSPGPAKSERQPDTPEAAECSDSPPHS